MHFKNEDRTCIQLEPVYNYVEQKRLLLQWEYNSFFFFFFFKENAFHLTLRVQASLKPNPRLFDQ